LESQAERISELSRSKNIPSVPKQTIPVLESHQPREQFDYVGGTTFEGGGFLPTTELKESQKASANISKNFGQIPSLYGNAKLTGTSNVSSLGSLPSQSGSQAQIKEFEDKRKTLQAYSGVKTLMGISENLQSGFESAIGYNKESSAPIKIIAVQEAQLLEYLHL